MPLRALGEVNLLLNAAQNTGSNKQANDEAGASRLAANRIEEDFSDFKNDFVAVNGRWEEGLGQKMFDQYMRDNPIDHDHIRNSKAWDGGKYDPMKGRKSLEEYKASGGWDNLLGKQKPAGAGAAGDTGSGASSGMPVVSSPADLAALPSGTTFIDPNGVTRRKK